MDKKILLSGAAALVLGASLFAAPASAAFDFGISGKSTVTLQMDDSCTLNTATELDQGDVTSATGFTDTDSALDTTRQTRANCGSNTDDNPTLKIANEASWSASSTLANGLTVSVGDDIDLANGGSMTLSGAFGSLEFKNAPDSAVKASFAADDGSRGVTGNGIGGHTLATSGAAGTGVLWTAPSMGSMDLYVSYFPNADNDGETNAAYMDTFGFGASMSVSDLTISAGFEAADGADCVQNADSDGDTLTGLTLLQLADEYLGGDACGDESLMAIGLATSAGGVSISAGYSAWDTGEKDVTVMNVRLGTSVGAYDLTLDYVDAEKKYGYAATQDDQTVLGLGLSTALGDGVNLKLDFSNNSYDIAGTGAETNYLATAKVEANF